jgi:hypothetical protein
MVCGETFDDSGRRLFDGRGNGHCKTVVTWLLMKSIHTKGRAIQHQLHTFKNGNTNDDSQTILLELLCCIPPFDLHVLITHKRVSLLRHEARDSQSPCLGKGVIIDTRSS